MLSTWVWKEEMGLEDGTWKGMEEGWKWCNSISIKIRKNKIKVKNTNPIVSTTK